MKKVLVALTIALSIGSPALAGSTGHTLWIQSEMWDGEKVLPKHTQWNSLKTYENLAKCTERKKKAFKSGWGYSQVYIQKPNIENISQIPNRIIRLHFADGKHSTARMYLCIPETENPRK
jgi:hypothetical protein